MKKTALFTIAILFFGYSHSQNSNQNDDRLPQVEQSISGIQAGLLGAWGYYEFKAASALSIRSELGSNVYYGGGGIIAAPSAGVEPRFYYNLKNRAKKGKETSSNAGNFFAVNTRYNSSRYNFTTSDNIEFADMHGVTFTGKWGIRRNLTKKIDFETTIGGSYGIIIPNNSSHTTEKFLMPHLQVRFGYKF